jgi:hypothetical protein
MKGFNFNFNINIMDKVVAYLSRAFVFSRLRDRCNIAKCDQKPIIEALIFEKELGKSGIRALASLYLCQAHINLDDLLENLNRLTNKNKKIAYKIKRIESFITY